MQAIEDGRFDDLPGQVYAIGFIRTYALYLHLDADELVRLFKDEQSGLTERQDLVFPAPPPDSRMSGVMVGVVALLLAGVAYGGWYYLSNQDNQEIATVAPVPDRLVTLLEEEEAALSSGEVTQTSEDEPDLLAELDAIEIPIVPDAEIAEDEPADTVAESDVPLNQVIDDGPGLVDQAQAADVGDLPLPAIQVEDEPPPVPVVEEAPIEQFAAVDLTDVVSLDSVSLDGEGSSEGGVVDASAPPEPPGAPGAEAQPTLDGVRVLMRATSDSWVLIRDASGEMIMTRVMPPGDSWEVPDQPGLTLFTGNAGGLEILVDGELVPAVGQPGEVIRNISLDPDLLRAGQAVISQ